MNVRTGNVRLAGKRIELTPKESRIMAVLASHPGEVYSKRDLIEEIWGEEYLDSAIAISVYIRRIRAKLEPDPSEPRYVQTVWHCGYRLTDEGARSETSLRSSCVDGLRKGCDRERKTVAKAQ